MSTRSFHGNPQKSSSVDTIGVATVDMVAALCAQQFRPILPSKVKRLHWPIADPAIPTGDRIYARLTDRELAQKPADEMPVFLVPGTHSEFA